MKKVLITGMSGLIGGILRRHLEGIGGYELSALNSAGLEDTDSLTRSIPSTALKAALMALRGASFPSPVSATATT